MTLLSWGRNWAARGERSSLAWRPGEGMPARVPIQDGWVCPGEQAIHEQEEHFCEVLPHQ